MAVQWALADQSKGFDYLESLRAIGTAASQQATANRSRYDLSHLKLMDAARGNMAATAASGNMQEARTQALGIGDFDFAKAIGAMADDDRKRIAQEGEIIGRAAYALRKAPQDQRATVFSGMVPHLRQRGFSMDELRGITDFSDSALDAYVGMSQSIRDSMSGDLTQARIDDVMADNARADRTAEDLMVDRATRRGLTARGQDMADARGRYGIGVASSDRRRAQDMTDRRIRETGGRKAPKSGPAVGTVKGGYRFKGGDPSSRLNWEPAGK